MSGRWSGKCFVRVAGFLVAALAVLPSAAWAKQVESKVGATIVYNKAVNPSNAGSCGIMPVLQWKDPTANKFTGTSWEAHYFWLGKEKVVTMAPPFHNKFTWLGVDFVATGGNNWWKPGGGTWHVGADPASATAACARYLATYQERYGSQAWVIVTGTTDTSDSAKCKKAEKAYDQARKKVSSARKQLAAAKRSAEKARARSRLSAAITARARAAAAVGKACNG